MRGFALSSMLILHTGSSPSAGLYINPFPYSSTCNRVYGIACKYLQLQTDNCIIEEKGGTRMANTSVLYARIDTELKDKAEKILLMLGISPSSAIQMLYSQIVLQQGMPFELKIPSAKPVVIGGLTKEQLDTELAKGIESLKAGSYSADDVDSIITEEFNTPSPFITPLPSSPIP